jgi:hypothetical protein
LADSESAGQLRDCLRGALVDRFAVAEERALEGEFRQLLHTLVRLGHVGGVLRIGTSELVADVVHGIPEDEQRPGRIEHAYVTRCVTGRCDHAQAEHFVVVTDRLIGRGDLICGMSAAPAYAVALAAARRDL